MCKKFQKYVKQALICTCFILFLYVNNKNKYLGVLYIFNPLYLPEHMCKKFQKYVKQALGVSETVVAPHIMAFLFAVGRL